MQRTLSLPASFIGLLLCGLVLWSTQVLPAMAQDTALPPGVQVLRDAELTVRLRQSATQTTTAHTLPLHWDVLYRRKAGWATATLRFDALDAQRLQPQALLISRLGNAYRVSLNGMELATGGELLLPNDGWTGRRPLWIRLPGTLLQAHNVLEIHIRADYLRRAGISSVQFGPEAALQGTWHALEWQRVTLPRAVSLFSLVVGIFCLLLWWQQRQALYAFAALCELAWACRVTAAWLEEIFLAWPAWFQAVQGLFWTGCFATYWLTRSVWGPRPRAELYVASGIFVLCPFAVAGGADWVLGWTVVLVVAWAALILRLGWECRHTRDSPRLWMLVALSVCWAALVRDIAAARLAPAQYMDGGWTQWAAAFAGVAVLAIVGERFQQARNALIDLTASLEQRVLQREEKLAEQHHALRKLERISAKSEERARILRDMHDGAGAHLITAMRQLEGGVASQAEVMQTLRESLDQLRLSVDAMSLPNGDVNALLASLRFRLEQRIRDSGLELLWDVELLPLWPGSSEEAMRHLQYIVFEAISNVLQHARARQVALTARADGQAITIHLRDDGVGRQDGACGNGLRTMQERAALIGAVLELRQEGDAGTTVCLSLPLGAPAPAQA